MNVARWKWTAVVLIAAVFASIYARRLNSIAIPQIPFVSNDWQDFDASDMSDATVRQMMMKDLIENILPSLTRTEIEEKLGKSPTHDGLHYFDQFDYDLIYPTIGIERIFLWDHRWQLLDPETESLIIRLNKESGEFESWYVDGSAEWPRIVGGKAAATYRRSR